MSDCIIELYGHPTSDQGHKWKKTVAEQRCPYIGRKCLKARKSEPELTIGTCSVLVGNPQSGAKNIVICPIRFLQKQQVFFDSLHLLTNHEPGNEIHVVSEISVPGGSVDYCLVSAHSGKVIDFVGIEIQTLDTTGTLWPRRQRFLKSVGISVKSSDADSNKSFGMNWKMSAKTILVQLHHKIQTFEAMNKHLVLIVQDHFLNYMRREFSFEHLRKNASISDPMHFHAYRFSPQGERLEMKLLERLSTDAAGIATCLGLQAEAKIDIQRFLQLLESRISDKTLLRITR